MYFKKTFLTGCLTMALSVAHSQTPPDHVTIAGGFNPIPLMIKAGEKLVSKFPQYKPPQILYNDSSVGFSLFCAGTGVDTPSINTATRQMRPAEIELCNKNGVNEIVEIKLGNDALVTAQAQDGRLNRISRKELFLAMAKNVPDPKDGTKLIPNPYKDWKEINPTLPSLKIQIVAPEPKIGLYQSFVAGVVLPGCRQIDAFKALETSDPKQFEAVCKSFRKDSAYIEYTLPQVAAQELKNNPNGLGLIPLTMVAKENLKNVSLDNIYTSFTSVAADMNDLVFPILVFVKKPHVALIPGFKDYLDELTSEDAIGMTGYFYGMGMIPLPRFEREQARTAAKTLKVVTQKKTATNS